VPPTPAGIELRRCGLAGEQTLIAWGLCAEGLTLAEVAAEFGVGNRPLSITGGAAFGAYRSILQKGLEGSLLHAVLAE
jgi:hypothetical protein